MPLIGLSSDKNPRYRHWPAAIVCGLFIREIFEEYAVRLGAGSNFPLQHFCRRFALFIALP